MLLFPWFPPFWLQSEKKKLNTKEKQTLGIPLSITNKEYIELSIQDEDDTKSVFDLAATTYPGNQANTKADAFRHAYFNASNTVTIGENLTKFLSNAH